MTERQADEDEFFYASAEKFPDFCNRFFSIQRQDIAECRPPLITESCGQFQNEFADVKLLHLGIAGDHDADGVGFHAGHYPVSDIGDISHLTGSFPDFAALLFGAEILPAVEYLGDGRNRKIDGGNDVTSQFRFMIKQDIALYILPRKVDVRTGNAEKRFDGTPLTAGINNAWVSLGSLAEGHTMDVRLRATRTEIGESQNACALSDVVIYDEKSNIVTDNYEITLYFGTLTVLP